VKHICILLAAMFGMAAGAAAQSRPLVLEIAVWKIYVQNDSRELLIPFRRHT